MDFSEPGGGDKQDKQHTSTPAGRPPAIVLTASTNLMQLPKDIRDWWMATSSSGAHVTGLELSLDRWATILPFEHILMAWMWAIVSSIQNQGCNQTSSNWHTHGRHLQRINGTGSQHHERPAANGTTPIPWGDTNKLPLLLLTLQRNVKSTDIFKLTSLCHIIIQVEACKARNYLKQCYNCQRSGHISENCRQPLRCMWCGGSHIHKECSETNNRESSLPNCSNCQLKDGDRPQLP
jgi:hypothetical protein